MQQVIQIDGMQIFRHSLAVGDEVQDQPVAQHHIQHRTQTDRLIQFGGDAADDVLAAIHAHHIIQRIAVAGRIQQQQPLHPRRIEHFLLVAHMRIALPHPHRIDQHQMLVAQGRKGQAQILGILYRMHCHTENLAVNLELFVGADPVAVSSQQRHLVRAVTHHSARRQLGGGSGLTHPCRADQRIHAALVDNVIHLTRHAQIPFQHPLDPVLALLLAVRQLVEQLARKQRAESGIQHSAQQAGALRGVILHIVPRQRGKLLLQHVMHGPDLAKHTVYLLSVGLRHDFHGLIFYGLTGRRQRLPVFWHGRPGRIDLQQRFDMGLAG